MLSVMEKRLGKMSSVMETFRGKMSSVMETFRGKMSSLTDKFAGETSSIIKGSGEMSVTMVSVKRPSVMKRCWTFCVVVVVVVEERVYWD